MTSRRFQTAPGASAADNAAALSRAFLRHILPGGSTASVQIAEAITPAWSATSMAYGGAPIRAWGVLPPDRVAVAVAATPGDWVWVNGIRVGRTSLLVLSEGCPVFLRAESRAMIDGVLVERHHLPDAWQSQLAANAGHEDAFFAAGIDPGDGSRLSANIQVVLQSAEAGRSRGPRRDLPQPLVEMFEQMPPPESLHLRRRHTGKAARQHTLAQYIGSAAFLHAEPGGLVPDMMAKLEIGRRTLEYEIQELAGMSPYAWITALRLDQVRRDLASAADRSRVGDVAARWGFAHHGRFARAYEARFGELPRQTAIRAARRSGGSS